MGSTVLTLTLILTLAHCQLNSSHVRHKRAVTGCGESLVKPLVFNGEGISPGEWPWIAAIFKRTNSGLDFTCGGSLVTATHVITVGHCVQPPSRPVIDAKNLVVSLGKHNIFSLGEEEQSQSKKVSQIHVYPQYNKPKLVDNDMAILVLASAVRFNDYVSPVCLWSAQNPPVKIAGTRGSFVGWGKNEKGEAVSEEPKFTRMPIVTQEQCVISNPEFSTLISENTFCAGSRDGSGPCSGDSGGGLYISETFPGNKKRWVLRGMVSKALKVDNDCDLSNYIIFTDVSKFVSWLKQVIPSQSFIVNQQTVSRPPQGSQRPPPVPQRPFQGATLPFQSGSAPNLPVVKLGSQNYYFSTDIFNKYVNWHDARDFCRQNGMQLAIVETPAVNRLLHAHGKTLSTRESMKTGNTKVARGEPETGGYNPWIGGTDEKAEGKWIWDATQRPIQFFNWWSYQPDGARNENCLFMYSDDGKWGDRDCFNTKPFICQVS